MSNYTKATDFAAKDALLVGNPSKVVRGTEIGAEFDAIESAVATKLDAAVINAATSKTTPVDADELPITDSAASYALKKLTWANLKATIKTYYDSVTSTLTNKTLTAPVLTNPTVTASSGTAMKVTNTGTGDSFVVEDSASTDATPFVINASGSVFIGNTATTASYDSTAMQVQVVGTSTTTSGIGATRFSADAFGSTLSLTKSRGATAGVYNGVVSSGDSIANIIFAADDGATPIRTAQISAAVDGTPGLNDMPGRLVFSTTADGASSPTEHLRIQSDIQGIVKVTGTEAVNGTSPVTLQIAGQQNSAGWTSGAKFGVLDFYSADVSGTAAVARSRAQVAAIMEAATGSTSALTFNVDDTAGTGLVEYVRISSSGLVSLQNSGGLSIARTAVTAPAASDGNVFSGTYTPTLTNTTNVAASTATVCQYMRVGSVVTVSGTVQIDPTAAGQIVMGMTLPIASAFTNARQCGGTFASANSTSANVGSITAEITSDYANFDGVVVDTANRTYGFTFTYQVI